MIDPSHINVAIDVDTTTLEFLPRLCERVNERLGTNVQYEDVTTWDCWETNGVGIDEFFKELRAMTEEKDMHVHEAAKWGINEIRGFIPENGSLFFLSDASKDREDKMREMLDEAGFDDIPLVLTEGKKKHDFGWDVLIDDRPGIHCPKGRNVIPVKTPYNPGFTWDHITYLTGTLCQNGYTGVALSGKMRSGKDTLAKELIGLNDHEYFVRLAQADALKLDAKKLTGLDFLDEEVKARHRGFLIDLGQFMRNQWDPMHWVMRTAEKAGEAVTAGVVPVITDVRFVNEAEFWRRIGFVMVRIDCSPETIVARGGSNIDDPSETELDWYGDFHLPLNSDENDPTELLLQVIDYLPPARKKTDDLEEGVVS